MTRAPWKCQGLRQSLELPLLGGPLSTKHFTYIIPNPQGLEEEMTERLHKLSKVTKLERADTKGGSQESIQQ